MSTDDRTTREKIRAHLRKEEAEAGALAAEFGVTVEEALSHVEHIARSLESADEELLVAPPACRSCGFEDFDDLINRPSRCPECKSENLSEPVFTVR
ncbi:HTH domain protein [Natronomonas pharaonis DSM 2160]|uniref:HTH domain protein n=1 Tax=Natronomonas pharaonis (strain ATCC 35678 / DSM 2160 / CIP 103997 / JCM 8858 / NBRC 14720 / NCIMB 2260 / Gabara) TaxID=348780 RepID=A0A1U7ETN9_NATPD|nr:transcriptional regulator [Natronomonas pharaonis]CAI48284.1 HTH domain protein [Natronomonas pharaonis DSM 2160]